jgi:FKBP-type peptidyl-prolyl cis-trans isomerase
MGEKIRKLKELDTSNHLLCAENEKSKQFLAELVHEYHESIHLVFKSRLHQQEAFNSMRCKVRMVLKELTEDYHYIGFVEHWNTHLETLQYRHAQIENRVRSERKAEANRAKLEGEKGKEESGNPSRVVVMAQKKSYSRAEEE